MFNQQKFNIFLEKRDIDFHAGCKNKQKGNLMIKIDELFYIFVPIPSHNSYQIPLNSILEAYQRSN